MSYLRTNGGGIPGTIKGRSLSTPGEGKPYMAALTKGKAPHCPLHKQVCCANGERSVSKNIGIGWKAGSK